MAGPADTLKGPGGSMVQQLFLYQVVGQLVAVLLAPVYNEIQRAVNRATTTVPLTAAELADMVVRHIIDPQTGQIYASETGINGDDFKRLVEASGEGLAVGDLAEALRRKIIPEHGTGPDSISFDQGIAESRTRDKWGATIKALSMHEPTPADALDALLNGQLTEQVARDFYIRFGGDPEHFTWLFDTRGSAPTPLEASEMANRGIIPWTGEGPDVVSFHQAFLEGPWRNKWEDPYRKLAEYKPPARTIVAMVRSGALTDAQALRLFQDLGMSQELAAAQLADAHHQKTATSRELAKGDIDQLYRDQLIDAATADKMYEALRYSPEEAAFLRSIQDVRRSVAAQSQAISRVHTLYVNRKLDKQTVTTTLDALHVPAAQRGALLETWDIERTSNVKVLTAAEIASAFFYQIIDQATATAELVNIGYSEADAWILLAVRSHHPLPNPPAGIVVPPSA